MTAIYGTPRRGRKLIAQGIALGIEGDEWIRPVRAKAFDNKMLLSLQGGCIGRHHHTQGDALG